jgi:LysM repeat protein
MGPLQKQDRFPKDFSPQEKSVPRVASGVQKSARGISLLLLGVLACALAACDSAPSWLPSHTNKTRQLAEQSLAVGDFPQAVRYYESCLDGTRESADVHYHLALIYDTKLEDPISALHHYRRHLRMDPSSKWTSEVNQSVGRIERSLAAKLSEGGLVTRAEAARLRNENSSLREQIAALRGQPKPKNTPPPTDRKGFSKVPETRRAEQAVGQETRTYTVQKGDTLASISRKFYNTSNRWKDIVDANHNQLGGGTGIREGQVLIIP